MAQWVVIDGANVSMIEGEGGHVTAALKSCIDYWKRRGHERVVAFVKANMMDERPPRNQREAQMRFDDLGLAKQMVGHQRLLAAVSVA